MYKYMRIFPHLDNFDHLMHCVYYLYLVFTHVLYISIVTPYYIENGGVHQFEGV